MTIATAAFGNPSAVLRASAANAAYARARDLGYTRTESDKFARLAKLEAREGVHPDVLAGRLVPPMRATFAGSNGGGAA